MLVFDERMKLSWDEFHSLSLQQRAESFRMEGKVYHTIFSQQFSRHDLEQLSRLATKIRRIAKSKAGMAFLQSLLPHKRAMLYFQQPSTRTFLSFHAACPILGMKSSEVREARTSSEIKGETPEDSVRTFSSFFDVIIMRHPEAGFAEKIAWLLSNTERPVPVINAGSGKDQHPTQALLDVYTLFRSFEDRMGIDGKSLAFCGDLKRGRTVRSLAQLLTNFEDIEMYFVAPPELQIESDITDILDERGVKWQKADKLEDVVPLIDAVYMTRLQDEWDDKGESRNIDFADFNFSKKLLKQLKPSAVIMHPLPRRNEIPDEIDNDPRAVYWRQVRNGMWIRAALFATIFRRDDVISDYYETNNG
ncbi:MAG: aspartate carbamoyltransferase [Planctomycetota bacterium]|nr:aspartate carbamoyltransferase [Planctomycetota bacterium]